MCSANNRINCITRKNTISYFNLRVSEMNKMKTMTDGIFSCDFVFLKRLALRAIRIPSWNKFDTIWYYLPQMYIAFLSSLCTRSKQTAEWSGKVHYWSFSPDDTTWIVSYELVNHMYFAYIFRVHILKTRKESYSIIN